MGKTDKNSDSSNFKGTYPNIADWVQNGGWIEIGYDSSGYCNSFIRALDEGGMIYEGKKKYESVDAALLDLDNGIREWLAKNG